MPSQTTRALRRNRALRVPLALLLSALALGCDPSAPTEAEARAWAEHDSARVDAFARDVLAQIEQRHLLATVEETDPRFFELEAQRGHDRALFRETAYPRLARALRVLGSRVRLVGNPNDADVLGQSGTPDAGRSEGVDPEAGFTLDGKKVGYGVYTVDGDEGAVLRVGYELDWQAPVGGRDVRFTLILPAPSE